MDNSPDNAYKIVRILTSFCMKNVFIFQDIPARDRDAYRILLLLLLLFNRFAFPVQHNAYKIYFPTLVAYNVFYGTNYTTK
jgi:hypothetical protein